MEKLEKRDDSHLFWDHEEFVDEVKTLAEMNLVEESMPQKLSDSNS
ncbi:MAG TPA: hypothetical protein VG965_05335 [Patescibacteria group bacterium]|nr:hypothetical protein [Patescibacteria group bacterium]